MPTNLRQTLEKAEGELITEVKEWVRNASDNQMRDIFAVLVSMEEIEEEEEEDEDEEEGPHPFLTLQEFATTWAQLNNLLDQVREVDGGGGEAEKSDAQTEEAASPGKASGRKGGKHRHCCEIGKHEAEAAEAASSKTAHPPPAAL